MLGWFVAHVRHPIAESSSLNHSFSPDASRPYFIPGGGDLTVRPHGGVACAVSTPIPMNDDGLARRDGASVINIAQTTQHEFGHPFVGSGSSRNAYEQ